MLFRNERPDGHPAVRPKEISPPNDKDPEILGRLAVRKSFAHQARFHCNACNTAKKFRENGYLAIYGDGWWYLIGPDCGDDNHRTRSTRAIRAYERAEAEALASGHLKVFLDSFEDAVTYFKAAVRLRSELYQASAWFLTTTRLGRLIRENRGTDGRLFITKQVRKQPPNSDQFYPVNEPYGPPLSGVGFLQSGRNFNHAVKAAHDKLSSLAGGNYEITVLHKNIVKAGEKSRSHELTKDVKELTRNLDAMRQAIVDAKAFLAHGNLKAVEDWHRAYNPNVAIAFDYKGTQLSVRWASHVHEMAVEEIMHFVAELPVIA